MVLHMERNKEERKKENKASFYCHDCGEFKAFSEFCSKCHQQPKTYTQKRARRIMLKDKLRGY